MKPGILIVFHTPTNAGYAMTALEKAFYRTCCEISGDPSLVHFSFTNTEAGPPKSIGDNYTNYTQLIYNDQGTYANAKEYIQLHNIKYAFCFDLQVHSPLNKFLRSCGVKKIISYWGASMSSRNRGLKLLAKRLEVFFNINKPDHFIFESEAMRDLAVNGRGIQHKDTSVIHTGINPEIYYPRPNAKSYVEKEFQLPENSNIAIYSGHMEERKGVHVIIEAAIELFNQFPNLNLYFIICGNRPGEEKQFLDKLNGTQAKAHVIFAGYRNDLPEIMPGCTLGIVASTGWDSFPMSTLEMAASGLPLLVSKLQGLVETVEHGVTGLMFEPGNSDELAKLILDLINDKNKLQEFSANAIKRISREFTIDTQVTNLKHTLDKFFYDNAAN